MYNLWDISASGYPLVFSRSLFTFFFVLQFGENKIASNDSEQVPSCSVQTFFLYGPSFVRSVIPILMEMFSNERPSRGTDSLLFPCLF